MNMDVVFDTLVNKVVPFASQIDGFLSEITWLIPDGSFVNIGSPLCSIKIYYNNTQLGIRNKSTIIEVKSPASGFLDIKYEHLQSWKKKVNLLKLNDSNNLLCRIVNSNINNLLLWQKYEDFFEYKIEQDAYTGQFAITWTDIFGYPVNWQVNDNILFELKRIGENDCLLFKTKERFDVGTKFSFLFTDNSIISFSLFDKPSKRNEKGTKNVMRFVLYEKELLIFSTKELSSCRVDFPDGDYKILFSFPHKYGIWSGPSFNTGMFFCLWFRTYLKAVKETLPDWQPKQSPDIESQTDSVDNQNKEMDEQVFVYLMIDKNTGYHKIGISNNPQYREHTLQNEKPTIDLLCSKRFPNRKIAQAIESALHSLYGNKRIRGEWFDLGEQDVVDIKNTLK